MKTLVTLLLFCVGLMGFTDMKKDSFDRVLRGGRIIDGTGNPWYYGDIGVTGDQIAVIAPPNSLDGKEIIDISGLFVSPGFIDMMGQSELQLFINPHLRSKITQGITTEFTGEGSSPAPNNDWIIKETTPYLEPYKIVMDWRTWEEYFEKVKKTGVAANFAFMVGATQVRQYAMKNDMRDPSPEELAQMKEQVEIAMKSGVFGLSTSLLYAPASYSKTDEIVELAKVASKYHGIYASHIRSESDKLLESIDEAIEIGKRANLPVEIWHLKVSGKQNFGKMKDALSRIENARVKGLDVTADIYPYTAGSTALAASLPKWTLEGGTESMLKRLSDAKTREKIKQEMMTLDPEVENIFLGAGEGKKIMIASVQNPNLKKYVGKTMEEIAKDHGANVAETLCWFVQEDRATSGAIYFTQSEEEMQKALKAPFVSFNCDYSAMSIDGILGKEHPHPRSYGTFPRVLGKYVREMKLISLEEAIRKMTSLPAQRLGLKKRGTLRQGNYADITVFNFDKIRDVATFEDPNHYSEGIVHVFVNGQQVVKDGTITAKLPGRILRHNQDN